MSARPPRPGRPHPTPQLIVPPEMRGAAARQGDGPAAVAEAAAAAAATRRRALRLLELSKKRHEKRAALAMSGEGTAPAQPQAREVEGRPLRGLDPALLARVRERQRQRERERAAAEAAAQEAGEGPRLSRMQETLLPTLTEHVRRLFRLQKRSVMLERELLPRLCGCTEPATSEADMRLLLGRLLELLPEWISRVAIRGQPYFKLRNVEQENSLADMQRRLRQMAAPTAV